MQQEGRKVQEICREFGISEPTFYKWKSKYSGMTLSELSRLRGCNTKKTPKTTLKPANNQILTIFES
jgi:transposase-like protein